MSISAVMASFAALFALITMIISIIVLVKVGALSHNSFQELEDAICCMLIAERRAG